MSKISVKRRKFEIKKKRQRRKKMAKLKANLAVAKGSKEKQEILTKLIKIAPHLTKQELSSQ